MIKPFYIDVPPAQLDDLRQRLAMARLPPSPEAANWEDGINLAYLAELVAYWRDQFDWPAAQAKLNRWPQFQATIDGTQLHFIHERGKGPAPFPLLLAHGWPDSIFRFSKLIPLLTDPQAHGGDAADAFDVIVPSLPGFGFSERLAGTSRYTFGAMFHQLMSELNYERYGMHGGDVGGAVGEQMAHSHTDRLVGIHLTDVPARKTQKPPSDPTAAEQDYLDQLNEFEQKGSGYMHLQGTKPWTPAAGLNDSPVGLAAWIVEKFYTWSDCAGDIETRYSKDDLLTNVMIYWVTQSIGTSFLAYRDFAKRGPGQQGTEAAREMPESKRVPAGFAIFAKDAVTPPREWAERFFDVQHWTEVSSGGHFAALEEPEKLAQDIRAFFRSRREKSGF